jgi:hypothetical protein
MITHPATSYRPYLTRAEESRLFRKIWHHTPDAPQARETLIQDNLNAVRTFILKQPAFSWYDGEDAEQEAYLHLSMALDEVPPSAKNPGGYLYKVACQSLQKACPSSILSHLLSLDAPIPGAEKPTPLQEILATPRTEQTPRSISPPLTDAIHRLPLRQQQALQEFFALPNFQPQANARRVPRSKATQNTDREREARYDAYHELRRDAELRQTVEATARNWARTPAKSLNYYRLLHGWSLQDAEEVLGINRSQLWAWEVGIRKPRGEQRARLCQVYGVTAEQLGL